MTDVLKYDKPLTNGRGPWRLITRTNQVSPSGRYKTVGNYWVENLNLIERNRSWLEFQNLVHRALEKIMMLQQPDTDTQWCDKHEPEHSRLYCIFM